MKLGIVGFGYVGTAVAEMFSGHYDVMAHDPYRREFLTDHGVKATPMVDRAEINACDAAFVCVPTPQNEDGRLDMTAIEDVFSWLRGPSLIVIKSTVRVGTTDGFMGRPHGLPVIFAPEYVGESSYWTEESWHRSMIDSPWYVFGGMPCNTSRAIDLYLPVCGPQKRYIQTDAKTAELAKLAENSLYAAKVLLWHELRRVAEAHGVPWHELRETILADPRQTRLHTGVWGKDGDQRPFGGKCFPKDLSELVNGAYAAGYMPRAFNAVQSVNSDWIVPQERNSTIAPPPPKCHVCGKQQRASKRDVKPGPPDADGIATVVPVPGSLRWFCDEHKED